MRTRPFVTVATAVALAFAGALPAAAGQQEATFTIALDPDAVRPGETTTVTGETSGPACTDDGVDVTLSYTKGTGANGTKTVDTTTDAEGGFTVELVVPDDATAGEPASVTAVIADCTADEGSTRTAKAVPLTIEPYDGTLTAKPASGRPGSKVAVRGTNCWGGTAKVVFTNGTTSRDVPVTLSGTTFTGTFTVPDLADGSYRFEATCPGSEFEVAPFRLVNPEAPPAPPARPAQPVTGPVRYTG